jgi:hypothetical protein
LEKSLGFDSLTIPESRKEPPVLVHGLFWNQRTVRSSYFKCTS